MAWRLSFRLLGGLALIASPCSALLDDPIVSFDDGINNSFEITRSNIICSHDDSVGIHIVAESLLGDLKEITGVERTWIRLDGTEDVPRAHPGAVIVGSIDSNLIKRLSSEGHTDFSAIEGKWESVLTTVLENPLPSVARALVIAGSDKRGTIFGVYTLSEQCGQSP
jgi:hypothetical protein